MTGADIPAVRPWKPRPACIRCMPGAKTTIARPCAPGVRVRCDAARGVWWRVRGHGWVDEMHLLNIAVDRAWHGQGVAQSLLSVLPNCVFSAVRVPCGSKFAPATNPPASSMHGKGLNPSGCAELLPCATGA